MHIMEGFLPLLNRVYKRVEAYGKESGIYITVKPLVQEIVQTDVKCQQQP